MQTIIIKRIISTEYLFYTLMVVGALIFLIYFSKIVTKRTYKENRLLFEYTGLTLLYFITFGLLTDVDIQSVLYILSKIVIAASIAVSLKYNFKFYKYKLFPLFFKINIAYVIISMLLGFGISFSSRNTLGIGNANEAGALLAFSFAAVITYSKNKSGKVTLGLLSFLLAISTGSRTAMLMLIIAILILTTKLYYKVLVFSFILLFSLFISQDPELGSNNSLSRLIATVKGDANIDRKPEFELAWRTALARPIFGNGIKSYQKISYEYMPRKYYGMDVLGPHNAYLSIVKIYGFFFGLFLIGMIIIRVYGYYREFSKNKDPGVKMALYVVVVVIVTSFTEDYIIGVNYIGTLLFFISASILDRERVIKHQI